MKTALTDVRVFDGRQLAPGRTVVIEDGLIGADPGGAHVIDGGGRVMLPGLIDATVLPATYLGLADRGMIEPGKRADLVLRDQDPLADIRATRSIRRIWIGGTECEPADMRK